MNAIRRQLLPALMMFVVATLGLGLVYPLLVTGVAQVAMPGRADGSLVEVDGRVVGSSLVGQRFAGAAYIHPRPSAAGADGYDALASAGSNLGPSSEDLHRIVAERAAAYRADNGLAAGAPVPVDAVTASGSGLDPHISVANAELQAGRVAAERGIDRSEVLALIDDHTDGAALGFLGEAGVDVLGLNLALDALAASDRSGGPAPS